MGKDVDLIQAVKAEDLSTVRKILGKSSTTHTKKPIGSAKQSNINQQDTDGLTVLHHAALAGNHSLMKLLLEHGVQVDVKDNKGLRPLHYAAWLGKEKPVELLLQSGSVVNDRALDGATPLHLACEHGHSDVVQKLLVHKADPSLTNRQHETPLDLACEFGRKRVVELLLACDLSNRLRSECSADVLENDRTTCLHLAARNGHVDVLKLLIEFGFNINRQTASGTCLHEAAKYGKTEVVRLLLSCGIDVSRLNSYEETALEIVNKFTASRAAKELKQMLKEASSEILARASRDYSKPLDASHLTFKEGDIIMVVDRFSKHGLWKGYCSSASGHAMQTGFFPSDAVVILDQRTAVGKISSDVLPSSGVQSHLANGAVANQTTILDSSISSVNTDEAEEGNQDPHQPLSTIRTKSASDINRDSGFSANNSCIGHSCTAVEIANGLQNRLSGQSSESGVSGISSYQASSSQSTVSCSQGSLDNLDESSFSSSSARVHDFLHCDLPDSELLSTWLRDLHLDEFAHLFINAGYDLPTVSRMTPEDLTAIGITQPSVRKKLKSEIARLNIPDGIPDFRPRSVKEWLNFLRLGEYNDMLTRQGYTDIDIVMGIMWEDLEDIGIQKLGHQKKIMLAIDRLRKISGSLHLQPTPISPVSSSEVQTASSIPHFTGSRSPASIISGSPHIDSFSPISLRTYSPSYDMMRHVNLKSSGEPVTLSPPQVNVPSFSSGSVQTNPGSRLANNVFPFSCHSCSSFRRNCENVCQNEIIGPAPPLPCKTNYKPGLSSTLTRNGLVSLTKEMENVNLTHPHQDWFPEKKQIGKMRTRGREMSCDMYSGINDYHLSNYGTLPRGLSFKGKGSSLCQHYGGLKNNFYDWYEAENIPVESFSNAGMGRDFDRQMSKPPTPPKRMNSFKNDTPMFGIAGEKLRSEASTPFHSSGLRLLDAVNLEGNFRRFCDRNYRPFGFSHPENRQLNRERILSNEIALSSCLNPAPAHVSNCDMSYRRDFNISKSSVDTEILEKGDQYATELNDCGLSSSQNLSSVSLNSNDSSGTLDGNSLPFANEDFGTIKERNTSSNVTDKSSEVTSAEQKEVDKKDYAKDSSCRELPNSVTQNVDSARHQNSGSKRNTEAVFDDIDGMLLGLTQELDEMLKHQT